MLNAIMKPEAQSDGQIQDKLIEDFSDEAKVHFQQIRKDCDTEHREVLLRIGKQKKV